MKIATTCFFILFYTIVQSQEIKDTLFFSNGTIVIGKIKRIKLGVVTFDPDDANDITVQLRKLRSITATWRIFRIETTDEHVYFGKLISTAEKNAVLIETSSGSFSLNMDKISMVYPFDKSIWQRFSGNVGVGFNYTKSSDFGRLNMDAALNYAAKDVELGINLSGIYTLTDSSFTRDREDVNIKANYYFSKNWFATAFLAYQRNLELGLERRYQEGLGIGNKFITTKSVYSWGRVGFVFNQERSTENVSSGTLVETYGQFELNLFRFEKPKINFVLTQTVYYGLTQAGRIRTDGDINIAWEAFKNFNITIEIYNTFDSKPPTAGSEKFDYGTVFGISYVFY